MRRRHPSSLPRQWLFTDERLGDAIFVAARALPPGSGIVVRHDGLSAGARWRLMRRLARLARQRNLTLLLAGSPDLAARWGADGVHLRAPYAGCARQAQQLGLIVSMPVHDGADARRARRARADLAFISPLYPTRSHPGVVGMTHRRWLSLARQAGAVPMALGGMDAARGRRLRNVAGQATGWAAIDAWLEKTAKRKPARPNQKRNFVPT